MEKMLTSLLSKRSVQHDWKKGHQKEPKHTIINIGFTYLWRLTVLPLGYNFPVTSAETALNNIDSELNTILKQLEKVHGYYATISP